MSRLLCLSRVFGLPTVTRRSFSTAQRPPLQILTSQSNDIIFNLATEEWLFSEAPLQSHILFLWRNSKTIVIGKHQNPWKECHIQALNNDSVTLARRRSGGGAVYQDLGNSVFSFLSPIKEFDIERNNKILINALQSFGVTAEASGRNDIVVEGKKISGAAFKKTRDRGLHHGTVLIDIDLNALGKYLNPNKKKLESKGVSSVQARVLNLSSMLGDRINHDSWCESLKRAFTLEYGYETVEHPNIESRTLDLQTLQSLPALNNGYQELKNWDWRFGVTPQFSDNFETRFNWGMMDVHIDCRNCVIEKVQIFSDCLYPEYIETLKEALQGIEWQHSGIQKAMQQVRQRNETVGERKELFNGFTKDFEEFLHSECHGESAATASQRL